jgi:hypothetical protein
VDNFGGAIEDQQALMRAFDSLRPIQREAMRSEALNTDSRELAEDAAEWLAVLDSGSSEDRAVFVAWLKKSPQHVAEVLEMMELDAALSNLLPKDPNATVEPRRYAVQRCLTLNGVGHRNVIPTEDVDRYRRTIIQMFLQRSIDRDSAEDLFQDLWLQVLEDNRLELLADTDELSVYLLRAAHDRVLAFRRGDISWIGGYESQSMKSAQSAEISEVETNLGHRRLAGCIKELLLGTPNSPDRKVLECIFLRSSFFPDVCEQHGLTDVELGQILWRARQLFGEIIRDRGVSLSDPDIQYVHEVRKAAMYVANIFGTKADLHEFECRILLSPWCALEVDVWRAIKTGMIRVERMREKVAC